MNKPPQYTLQTIYYIISPDGYYVCKSWCKEDANRLLEKINNRILANDNYETRANECCELCKYQGILK